MKEVGRSKGKGGTLFFFSGAIIIALLSLFLAAHAQPQTQPITDPAEARALETIFQKWGLGALTGPSNNRSGDVCSDRSGLLVTCDCSSNKGLTCHIIKLEVYQMNVAGPIPDELWSLTYLTDLALSYNVLTGPLSPSIRNLTRLNNLDLHTNALAGELPKELGMLSNLTILSLGENNFSGHLPLELGNLTNLWKLSIENNGFTGQLPSTLANLQDLIILWASNNGFTGTIPDFIGNLSQLAQLDLPGNSFDGPIPSSLSKLKALTDLRISGVLSGSSSLEFIKDMKNLTKLILRNNNISGFIPPTIGDYSSLKQLDLSFNNLNGQIPDSLFQLDSLIFLSLGNNSLTGTLPANKISSLTKIDVSYNFLNGSIPSWVDHEIDLDVNLVGNNFTLETSSSSSSSSRLSLGLQCLQRNFPCNRGKPIHSSFAINCGGPNFKSTSKDIFYESDDTSLGMASYYLTDTQNWAVSNVGYFIDWQYSSNIFTSSPQSLLTNTTDIELYQTARISASSLRYYGLGLENGNYTVRLQFAELAFGNTDWNSLGKRIFDIYIQGNIVAKDFDIKKEAGGVSFAAVEKNFNASVTENYLEIHFFWAGKGTWSIPTTSTYGPFISAIAVTRNGTGKNITPTKVIDSTVVAVTILSFLVILMIVYLVRRRRLNKRACETEEFCIDTRPSTFSYLELKAATDGFNPINKLGEGGFGTVFRGVLPDGRFIAVKLLSATSKHGRGQFVTEIKTISAVQHRNLVKLYGCCIHGDRQLLVYEYLENNSLDQALFGKGSLNLNWETRYEICLGVARGLAYLHEESRTRIIHRDVKASNILLDANLCPKISDFGLAKLYDDQKSHISTRVAGTVGYLAPEYAMRGLLTEKTDVFAFGIVALELVSGRRNLDQNLGDEKAFLPEWAWKLHQVEQEIQLVDPLLSEFDDAKVKRVVMVGLLCTQVSPILRPTMTRVVTMLSGDSEVAPITREVELMANWKYNDIKEEITPICESSSGAHISSSSTIEGR